MKYCDWFCQGRSAASEVVTRDLRLISTSITCCEVGRVVVVTTSDIESDLEQGEMKTCE